MIYDAERGDMTIAVVGDAMISRRMRAFRELHFLKLVEITGLWRFFVVLYGFTQKTSHDRKVIAQFRSLLTGLL